MKQILWAGRAVFLAGSLAATSVPALAQTRADFNGDGLEDLAVGLPWQEVDGVPGAGAVRVYHGRSGTTPGAAAASTLLHAALPGGAGSLEADAGFGLALAAADFDDDGYSDLAVGVPGRDVGSIRDAGAVIVFYGSPEGLVAAGSEEWTSDTPDVPGTAETGDRFGTVLVAAEKPETGQGFLAIGTPYEDVSVVRRRLFLDPVVVNVKDAGAVTALYFNGALWASGSQEWTEESAGIAGVAQEGDRFGAALGTGYFGLPVGSDLAGYYGYDSFPDLAIGVPGQDVAGLTDAGAVHVLYQETSTSPAAPRLTGAGSQYWDQEAPGVPGNAEPGARFGAALAGGDFGDEAPFRSRADLAIGVPGQNVDGYTRAGAVVVLTRDPENYYVPHLVSYIAQYWTSNTPGVPDSSEMYDYFGSSLAVGDFNGDGRDDLAVGAPNEDYASPGMPYFALDTGAVTVLYGTPSGLGTALVQQLAQTVVESTLDDDADAHDRFGQALGVANLDGSGPDELIVGVPGEDVRADTGDLVEDAGGFRIFRGGSFGLRWNLLWSGHWEEPVLSPYASAGYSLQ